MEKSHPTAKMPDQLIKQWGSLADMAQNARQAGLASAQPVDTAARSREILNAEYADDLKRRRVK